MELKERIATVIQVNQHTASSFADLIGVQRSRVSHILNGRNKPSIDFIERVLENFPRVDPGWLITGKSPDPTKKKEVAPVKESETTIPEVQTSNGQKRTPSDREIQKIVVFYTDQTFETYDPAKS